MNVKLLLKVKAAILKEPRKFRMETFFSPSSKSPCGTTACIAGHALVIGRKWKSLKSGLRMVTRSDKGNLFFHQQGAADLGISIMEAHALFYATSWPQPFRDQYYEAVTKRQEAKVAARRIQHFIDTGL